jgi:putative exosortase-associated protein (TIGR04073 family)
MKTKEQVKEAKLKRKIEKDIQEEVKELVEGKDMLIPDRKGILRKGFNALIKLKRKGGKMKKMKTMIIVAALLSLAVLSADNSYAYEETNAFGKLTRGVVNIASSPIEIFRNIYNESQYENVGYGMTVGLGKGIVQTVLRLGAGAVETVTFPFNFPDEYKDPIIEPEYVWEDWGY